MTPTKPLDEPTDSDLFPPTPEFEGDPDVEELLTRHIDQMPTEEILRRLVNGTGDLF